MSFMGGGFFGSGASTKTQSSSASEIGQQLNESTGSTAIGLSNMNLGSGKNSKTNLTLVSSDYGAIGAALSLTEKNLATSSAFATDGMSMVSKSLNDSASLAYDGLNVAGRVLDNTAALAYDGISKASGIVTDVINMGAVQNLEFLGKVENFSELAANHWLESAKLADSQARYAMDYTAKENSANRVMLSDANRMVGDAYQSANQGLLALADVSLDKFANMQNEALKVVNLNASQAQTASLKAMDMVFQSTKSADERTVQDTTKWIMGGLIAVVALVVVAPMLKGK
ncbi:MAG: hypothetical protein AAGC78_10350 [Cellvibrio sp.]|uniref:hypothetical protein n=1 Tax=Cellvibrio sp. TaxID=1965322 RepID=UPI0031A974B9